MLWLHFNEKEKVVDWGMFTLQVFTLTTLFKESLLCQQRSNLFIFDESIYRSAYVNDIDRFQFHDGYGDLYSTYNHCLFQHKVNVLGSLERAKWSRVSNFFNSILLTTYRKNRVHKWHFSWEKYQKFTGYIWVVMIWKCSLSIRFDTIIAGYYVSYTWWKFYNEWNFNELWSNIKFINSFISLRLLEKFTNKNIE